MFRHVLQLNLAMVESRYGITTISPLPPTTTVMARNGVYGVKWWLYQIYSPPLSNWVINHVGTWSGMLLGCVLCFTAQELIRISLRYHISVLLACGGHGFGACGVATCGDLLYLLKVVLGWYGQKQFDSYTHSGPVSVRTGWFWLPPPPVQSKKVHQVNLRLKVSLS